MSDLLSGLLGGGRGGGLRMAAVALLLHQLMKRSGQGARREDAPGGGGLEGMLGGLLGGGAPAGQGGGLGGLLGGGMGGGGLGGILGGLLGGMAGGGGLGGGMGRGMPGGGGLGGLAGGLGGMKGVALMALLAYMMRGRGGTAGLSSLTDQLRSAGLGDRVDSWVGTGPNEELRPEELARAIPPEAMDDIERHTGLGRDEVLSELSRGLPQMVNRLTPQGRLPERDDELNDHHEDDVLGAFGLGPMRRG